MAEATSIGPLQVATGDNTVPDVVALYSKFPLRDAPLMQVVSPLPPVGTPILLTVNIPGVFVFNASYTIASGDTPATVAQALVNFFNSGAGNPDDVRLLQAAGVQAQPGVGGLFGITNPNNGGIITMSDASGLATPVFSPSVASGNAAWDAGPILAIGKTPVDASGKGVAPPIGSNIGQIIVAAYGPNGEGPLQYLTIGFNVLDPTTGDCEFAIYSQNTKKTLLSLSSRGLVVNGKLIG